MASQMDPHLEGSKELVLYCGRNRLPVMKVRMDRRISKMVNVS